MGNSQARSRTLCKGSNFASCDASLRSMSLTAKAMNATQVARVHPLMLSTLKGFKAMLPESPWRTKVCKTKFYPCCFFRSKLFFSISPCLRCRALDRPSVLQSSHPIQKTHCTVIIVIVLKSFDNFVKPM